MSDKATKLSKLKISELSGVDAPANEVPGWVVAKAAEFKVGVEAVEKAVCGIFDGLTSGEADLYFTDAPADVAAARETLAKHIAKDIEQEDGDVATATGQDVAKSVRDIFSKAGEGEGESQEPAGEEQQGEEQGGGDAAAGDEPGAEAQGSDEPASEGSSGEQEGQAAEAGAEGEQGSEGETKTEKSAEQAGEGESAEAIAKALVPAIEEGIAEPLRKAVIGLAERIEAIEKHAAGQSGLEGQEVPGDEGEESSGITKAITAAVRNGRVELN